MGLKIGGLSEEPGLSGQWGEWGGRVESQVQ